MPFRLANIAGRAALVEGEAFYDLATVSGGALGADPMAAIAAFDQLAAVADRLGDATPSGTLAGADVRSPVPSPTQVFGIGLNYADHIVESGMERPAAPVVFTKFATCIAGPGAEVPIPNESIDYEAELVVVIGTGGRNIPASQAWVHVAGVTGGQDISDRALQFAAQPAHFALGKSRPNFGPLGPVVASVDCLADPDDIPVECLVNGETRQKSSTKHLIFDVPFLVEYLSGVCELLPGDIIFTGTPAGIGMGTGNMLRPGDLIETRIGGVGSFTNRCVPG